MLSTQNVGIINKKQYLFNIFKKLGLLQNMIIKLDI